MCVRVLFVALLFFSLSSAQQCSVSPADKLDCGVVGSTEQTCQQSGCCWSPVNPNPNNEPWCFHPAGFTCSFNATTNGQVPFSPDEVETMRGFFLANIDISGKGGVVASPDKNTPGGSYYYHWQRDGALTMQALMYTTPDSDSIMVHLKNYCQWVLRKQELVDPNGIDIRTEPKYYLPDGGAYDAGWCRPQNDGPALRAVATMEIASILLKQGDEQYVKQYLWTGSDSQYNGGAIKYDLDYILEGWNTESCDLWEEIRSSDLFWNRFWFVRALNMGASFAQQQGDQATAAKYTSLAKTINDQLVSGHYNGQYLFEDKSRTMDGGVIVALNDAYDGGLFSPSSSEVAGTILSYNKLFCNEYAINQQDNKNGIPGMLYGRYGGDVYAGGNPWVLTTAALARLYYRAAKEVVTMNALPSKDALSRWAQILSVDESRLAATSPKDLAAMLSEAGDAVLVRLRYHVAGDGFHLAEQLDRDKGFAKSAADLTWSYAETLKAMTEREQVSALLQASPVITLN